MPISFLQATSVIIPQYNIRHECHLSNVSSELSLILVLDNLQGELVYVNYGRVEDYRTLEKNLSMKVDGKIALVRYGKIFRGDKVCYYNFLYINISSPCLIRYMYTEQKKETLHTFFLKLKLQNNIFKQSDICLSLGRHQTTTYTNLFLGFHQLLRIYPTYTENITNSENRTMRMRKR